MLNNNRLDNSVEIANAKDILYDFVSLLDEAIATHRVLEGISYQDPRPGRLLYCHIINGFDSFITSLIQSVILSNSGKLREYLKTNKKFEQNTTFNDVLAIVGGIDEWMKNETIPILEDDLKRKRHSQKLEFLLKHVNFDYEQKYVSLFGLDNLSAGCLKDKPTPKSKLTENHKTMTEDIIGYADILYEKRNAITHNYNYYPIRTAERLNQTWSIQIKKRYVMLNRDAIKAIFRFYTSVSLEIVNSDTIQNSIGKIEVDKLLKDFENLKRLENIQREENILDRRITGGGIEEREKQLLKFDKVYTSLKDYQHRLNISPSTAYKDFQKYEDKGIIKKTGKKRGNYRILGLDPKPRYMKLEKQTPEELTIKQ